MPGTRHIHAVDPVYGPPVIRAPSPTDSISTEYGPDETVASDRELTDEQFARKCEERIGLRKTSWADDEASRFPVLLPKPRNANEEDSLFEQVMMNLRKQVKALEEDELFEAAMLKNLSPAFEQQPSSHDIDSIMRSMMGTSNSATNDPSRRKSPMPKPNGNDSNTAVIGHGHYGNMNSRF